MLCMWDIAVKGWCIGFAVTFSFVMLKTLLNTLIISTSAVMFQETTSMGLSLSVTQMMFSGSSLVAEIRLQMFLVSLLILFCSENRFAQYLIMIIDFIYKMLFTQELSQIPYKLNTVIKAYTNLVTLKLWK